MEALLARSELELQVELGSVELPTSSMIELEVGDTIVLDQRVGRPMDILVDGRPRFRGLPGLSGKHLGIRVTEAVEQEYGFDAPAATGLRLPPVEMVPSLPASTQPVAAPAEIEELEAPDAPIPLHPESVESASDEASPPSATHAA